MAKTPIGAVIELEGGAQYLRELKQLAQYTKEWKSETDKLTSSFDKNFKSMSDVNKQRQALQKEVDALNKQLKHQQDYWEELATTMNNTPTEAQQKAFSELRTSINETATQLNNVSAEMDDLPADNFIGNLKLLDENIKNSDKTLKIWGDRIKDVGKSMTMKITLPIVGAMTASVKSAVDWESAVNGVVKTTGLAGDELETFKSDMQDMALTTTYSAGELMSMAQIAGQLGVHGGDDLLRFVQVVSDLGIATDLTGEEAATALARIFNITENGKFDNLEALGSVIVHLGNNMATTEPEIVAMANRMASAGHSAGLATTDIFALSSALTSVGITAEAGGSTVGQVLKTIQKDVSNWRKTGEGDLLKLAEISGMTAEQFATTWSNEPIKAFEAFVTGLGNLKGSEEDIVLVLDELDMAGIRQSNMLQALAAAQEEGTDTTQLFSEALRLTKEAYDGVAEGAENYLTKEADVKKGESATTFSNLKESLEQLAIVFGEQIVPTLIPFVESLTELVKSMSEMDEGTKKAILSFGTFVAVIGPVVTFIGSIISAIGTIVSVAGPILEFVGQLGAEIGIAVSEAAAAGTPVGWIIAAIAAIIALCVALWKNWDVVKEKAIELWEVVSTFFSDLKEKYVEVMANIIDSVSAWFADMAERFTDGLANLIDSASTFFTNLKEGFVEMISNIIENVSGWIAQTKESFANMISNVMGALSGFWSNIKTGFVNMMSNVINTVSSLVDRIKNFFSNLVSSAWNWGKDMLSNLVEGFKSKVSAVVDAVSGVAKKIASFLHFSEPDVGPLSNFHTWMPDMMQGLAKGIKDNEYLVTNALDGLTNGMASSITNYGGVSIMLNVPEGANGRQIVDEIETELAARTMRRKAVFG